MKPKELVIPAEFIVEDDDGLLKFGEPADYYGMISDCKLALKFREIFGWTDGLKLEIVIRERRGK